ncbi:alpha/beta fold hydrolase [Agromyces sp. GXQ0307]|uniref:alpha/beta fold hydrolase n=1 Tax=Agromyces sp. GXQ0307 TaxID=3377835 RepID=UPI00383A599B
MTGAILPGITSTTVTTPRYTAQVLERPADATADTPRTVLFVHGNVSSSLFWQPTMLALPGDVRALAVDLRGFGGSETLPVDATRGLGDFAEDLASVIAGLGLDDVHLVGWSMGGGVVMQALLEHRLPVASVTLVNPVSPYGFGATDAAGALLTPDAAGSGGGGANPDFIARLRDGDRTADAPSSPRSVYLGTYVTPGFTSEHDDLWVESMLTTAIGEGNYPGDSRTSENWPGFAPGDRGVLNTMAPTHFDASGIVDLERKPPILWIRGANDVIVSDTSLFDLNNLGALGVIPGWPGAEVAPPQPMIAQTRAVLDRYAERGGSYREAVFAASGHSPLLEEPERFVAELIAHVTGEDAAAA